MPIDLEGNWRSGRAYDLHTTSSTYLGVNEFGHSCFDNTYSEMGELVYRLKYGSDRTALGRILELLDSMRGIERFDYLVPIPPTKKDRSLQPVEAIAVSLGERRGVQVLPGLLINTGDAELKGITDPVARDALLRASIKMTDSQQVVGKNVLLIDDLYRSGSTLKVATDVLYSVGKAAAVCVLTMTKTRSNR